jgi:uncharacterized protein YndB with AHSA1/START domain
VQTVSVQQDFRLPVDRVYAYLSEHEHLGPLFGATITRVKDGDTSRNGVGSVRSLRVGPAPAFQETVTEAVDGELIRYRITQGSPLKGHEGVMRFTSLPDGGSHLDYTITFDGKVPGLGAVVAFGLKRNITKGLKQVDAKA